METSINTPGFTEDLTFRDVIMMTIETEREYQVDRWGTDADTKVNTPMDFVGYINHHSTRWFEGGFRPYSRKTLEKFQESMIEVAALATAAIEATQSILNGEVERPDVLAA